jgi:hypothetical protein
VVPSPYRQVIQKLLGWIPARRNFRGVPGKNKRVPGASAREHPYWCKHIAEDGAMEPFWPTPATFPIAEAVADRTLALPWYNNFRRTDAERAAKQLCRAIKSPASPGHGVREAK